MPRAYPAEFRARAARQGLVKVDPLAGLPIHQYLVENELGRSITGWPLGGSRRCGSSLRDPSAPRGR